MVVRHLGKVITLETPRQEEVLSTKEIYPRTTAPPRLRGGPRGGTAWRRRGGTPRTTSTVCVAGTSLI
jgi:hypothetical protein